MQVLPTPESPISNSLTNKSYCLAITKFTNIYITNFFRNDFEKWFKCARPSYHSVSNPRYIVNIFLTADVISFLNPFVHDVTHKQKQKWDKES